jgi:hypothetical protein
MLALRIPVTGAFSGRFWLSALCAAFMPTSIGYQDLAALFAHQPGVSERWRDHLIASPFGTIEAATFSFSRPIGTLMPEPLDAEPVNFDPRSLDVKAWSAEKPLMTRPALQIEYPTVNRRLKGDRMPMSRSAPESRGPESLPPLQPVDAPASQPASPPAPATGPRPKSADNSAEQFDPALSEQDAPIEAFGSLPTSEPQSPEVTASVRSDAPAPDARDGNVEDASPAADKPPEIPAAADSDPIEPIPSPLAPLSFLGEDSAERDTQLYFGVAAMGSRGGMERWEPGAEPVLVPPSVDSDIKLSVPEGPIDAGAGGESVAGKDDTGRFKSPAVRLGLIGKPRAKAEKCVADAVYFEARGEPLRGQMAVAQVVMNRVFSGRYPNDVCGVVYQNAGRHLACQFTFACEGKDLSRIDEPDMWEQAKRIAKDELDGKIWLAEVGHATHYHAYWVHPSWVHEMAKLYKLGVHTFYRPRAWGDGSDAPIWTKVLVTPKPPVAAAKVPEAASLPAPAAGKKTHTAKL